MKTTKRNARTTTIFNGIMTAIIRRYGIKEDMSLKEMYDAAALAIIDHLNFIDKNGKTILNTIGKNKELTNTIRRLSFPKLAEYSLGDETIKENIIKELSVFSFNDYNPELVKDYDIIDIRREYSKCRIDYGVFSSDTNSTFLQELLDQYRLDKFHKESYLFLIEFEDIFGYQCITRKEFDRIRYIIFGDLSIYDVMNGYMIPGFTTCLLNQKYFVHSIPTNDDGKIASRYGNKGVISKVIDDELIPRTSGTVETVNCTYSVYDYEKILDSIVFKKIRNMLLSFGRGVSQEEIYEICGTLVMDSFRQSFKYLIPDHYSADDVKHRISIILKNEFQLKHAILTDDKKIYPAYQERQESNI